MTESQKNTSESGNLSSQGAAKRDENKKQQLQPTAPPLELLLNDVSPEEPGKDENNIPKDNDPLKSRLAYNCTAALQQHLKEFAEKNKGRYIYKESALFQGNSKVIQIGSNSLRCYNNGGFEVAAELILKLPADKQPKVITLEKGTEAERLQFAKILRTKGIQCQIKVITVNAHGQRKIEEIDASGSILDPNAMASQFAPR